MAGVRFREGASVNTRFGSEEERESISTSRCLRRGVSRNSAPRGDMFIRGCHRLHVQVQRRSEDAILHLV